jgi:type IV secretory pathway VirB2 component (pilin)
MMESLGGYLWLVIDVVFVAALATALAFGLVQWRRRRFDRAMERARRGNRARL